VAEDPDGFDKYIIDDYIGSDHVCWFNNITAEYLAAIKLTWMRYVSYFFFSAYFLLYYHDLYAF